MLPDVRGRPCSMIYVLHGMHRVQNDAVNKLRGTAHAKPTAGKWSSGHSRSETDLRRGETVWADGL